MNKKNREFVAIVWKKESVDPGVHETIWAQNLEEARAFLEGKYGKDILVSLTDIDAAKRPR